MVSILLRSTLRALLGLVGDSANELASGLAGCSAGCGAGVSSGGLVGRIGERMALTCCSVSDGGTVGFWSFTMRVHLQHMQTFRFYTSTDHLKIALYSLIARIGRM